MTGQAAFFDVAGTIIRDNPWRYIFDNPRLDKGRVSSSKMRLYTWYFIKKFRIIDDTRFRHHWITGMAPIFKGLTRAQIDEVCSDIISQSVKDGEFLQPVIDRISEHKRAGVRVVLVSGLFDVFVKHYAQHVGADSYIGSPLGFDNDVCTGKVPGQTIGGPTKIDAIVKYLKDHGLNLDMKAHYAYADSYSDVPMLSAVGSPVATYPEPELLDYARAQGWSILGSQQG